MPDHGSEPTGGSEPAGGTEPVARPARVRYAEELDQLRLQVELMGVRVDENLERMREVLRAGDAGLAEVALSADDEVDAMNVSLIERCYALLAREGPVASDLRLIASVVKILNEFERVGDLALRVVKAAVAPVGLQGHDGILDVLVVMGDEAVERFRLALRAWATQDLEIAEQVAAGSRTMDALSERLVGGLLALEGDDAVAVAIAASAVGRSLDRIADHAAIVGARVRYMVTGEPRHLAAEVR
jgi:phosphate transport system protein